MSIWTIMNGAAWTLAALLLLHMAWDFIKVEKQRRASERDATRIEDRQP